MPSLSLLQHVEQRRFSQIRAFAGEVLYTEGMPATHLYVIKEGQVDLFLVRDEKRTVVETLGRGDCFGIEPHLGSPTRLQGAAARGYCEFHVIDAATLGQALAQCPPLAQGLLHTMSERLTVAHGLIARRVNHQSDLQLYAQLLYLMGLAELGRTAVHGRGAGQGAAGAIARPLLKDVAAQARALFGHADRHVRDSLGKLASLHLVRIEDERGTGQQVIYAPRDIVAQVRRCLEQTEDGGEKQSYETLGVDEFAALVGVDRHTLLAKLAGGEFADELFAFRRSEIVRLLDEKGRRYFADRRMKTPEEFSELADLAFADGKALFAAAGKLDSLELARLLSTLEGDPLRERLLGALSRRRREEVESDLQGLRNVDPVEVQRLSRGLIAEVQRQMLEAVA